VLTLATMSQISWWNKIHVTQ